MAQLSGYGAENEREKAEREARNGKTPTTETKPKEKR